MAETGRYRSAGNSKTLESSEEQLYSVGEVCSMTGTTRKTLFYYDRIGLLTPTRREGVQNFKEYDIRKIQRLRKIIQYREAGLKITEIRELLDDKGTNHLEVLQEALERVQSERTDADKKIRKLQELIEAERNRQAW